MVQPIYSPLAGQAEAPGGGSGNLGPQYAPKTAALFFKKSFLPPSLGFGLLLEIRTGNRSKVIVSCSEIMQ